MALNLHSQHVNLRIELSKMKTLLTITITIILTTLIVRATDVEMSAEVELTLDNCVTTCISECKNKTITLTEDSYSEEVKY